MIDKLFLMLGKVGLVLVVDVVVMIVGIFVVFEVFEDVVVVVVVSFGGSSGCGNRVDVVVVEKKDGSFWIDLVF